MKNRRIELFSDDIGAVEYIDNMGSDLTVVNSARVSFGVNKKVLDYRDKKLINYLINHKHTSTLEHNVITFKFTVPLFIRSQHHRHRTWSYNEISRRYTDVDMKFYTPEMFRTQHVSNRQASNVTSIYIWLFNVNQRDIKNAAKLAAFLYLQINALMGVE